MPALVLSGSVGQGGVNNAADVKAVQQRLKDLGFAWLTVDGASGPNTIRAIKLFQSIKNGKQTLEAAGSDGCVDVGGETHKWLQAANAPQWKKLPASGVGYVNIEVSEQPDDNHKYGTDWLATVIEGAATHYKTNFLNEHAASLLTINDASPEIGGDTPDHKGHETGLSCDMRLPVVQAAGSTPVKAPAGTWESPNYSRDAARAVLLAFKEQPLFVHAFFNDPDLIAEGLCSSQENHSDHIHIDIKAPTRQD